MKKIIIVDGLNLMFRMYYGIPRPINNKKGKDIRGVIGFIGSLKKIVKEFKPYSLIVIFDSETSKDSNLKIDKNYKKNRVDYTNIPEDNNPFSQLPLIKKALEYLDIQFIEVENSEADDFIASIIYSNRDNQYIVVSTDSDFIQLVDNNTLLYVPRGKKGVLYTKEEVIKKYNILPAKYVIFKSLVGDRSDNIKGISGIGKITASKILNYGSIQNYISVNQNSNISNKLTQEREKIIKNEKLIAMNNRLDTSIVIFAELSNNIVDLKTYEIIEKAEK